MLRFFLDAIYEVIFFTTKQKTFFRYHVFRQMAKHAQLFTRNRLDLECPRSILVGLDKSISGQKKEKTSILEREREREREWSN